MGRGSVTEERRVGGVHFCVIVFPQVTVCLVSASCVLIAVVPDRMESTLETHIVWWCVGGRWFKEERVLGRGRGGGCREGEGVGRRERV